MRRPWVVMLGLFALQPAQACDFSAADFRSIFDREIASPLKLQAVSEYNCQEENGAAFCDMVTPANLSFFVEDAPQVKKASLLVMSGGNLSASQATQVIERLSALCSPLVGDAERHAALAHGEEAPRDKQGETQVIIGDVSYRLIGQTSVRIKDRRLPNAKGVNTSDDE